MDGLVDREAAAKRVDRDADAPPVASLTACATCSGERPRAWNVTTPYPASGSSPSHSGRRCVPSKRVLVLYSSYLPSKAADLVRFRRLATSACVSGLKVRTASRASPGFVDTPNRTKSAIGVGHGEEAAAAIVLAGVQGGSDQGGAGEREECQHRGA